jgi:hypothetical protein
MPYNPGIQDISGQIRAQGSMAGAQGFARGIGDFADGFARMQKKREEDAKAMAAMKATQSFIKANAKDLGISDRELEELTHEDPRLPPAARHAKMGEVIKNSILKIDLKEKQAQQAAHEQQRAFQEFQLAQAQRKAQEEQAILRRLQQFGQLDAGVGTGVLRPEVQERMKSRMESNPMLRTSAQIVEATGRVPATDDLVRIQSGGAPTSAMRDTEAILQSEIKAGKLTPAQVSSRRAELLSAGGRDPGDIYDNAGVYVDIKTGANARAAVKARRGKYEGQIGFMNTDGSFEPVDTKQWKPTTVSDTNALLDPPGMEKLREKVIGGERAVRQLSRYLNGFENLEQGAGQLADRAAKAIKTIFTKEPLTEEEKAVGVQQGRLQSILGSLRTSIVGPGVMTEQDAQRIVDALGGDVSALQNQEIVSSLIGEILQEKLHEYESDLDIYNTQVTRKYGSQAGYKQRVKVPVEFKSPAKEVAAEAEVSAPSGVWSDAKEKRLEELRKKLGK